MKPSNAFLVILSLLIVIVLNCEAIFFPKNKIEVRHVYLEPTDGEWRQQKVLKEVWEKPLMGGEWKQEWHEEWANVKVPGEQKWKKH
ncbi:hypothetical protein C0J52_16166 [Blattella germanica]|nr:hypothetical protein C0J52_16166 [Blattella germanica]